MATEKTQYMEWDRPVFPSDNLATELAALFSQIDYDVFASAGGLSVSDDGTKTMDGPTDINFGSGLAVTDDTDGTVTVDADVHTRYTDAEAVTAVNSETSLDVDISGDADTVDGKHASDFALSGHNHDGQYASSGHNHDGRYVQQSGDWEIQKNGTDGAGIINFKT